MNNEIKKWEERVQPAWVNQMQRDGYGVVEGAMMAEIAELRARIESLAAPSVASGAQGELPPLPDYYPTAQIHNSEENRAKLYAAQYARAAIAAQAKLVAMTDEQIKAIATTAVRAGKVSWLGYEKDEDGKYTIPVLALYHYQFAQAILANSAPNKALVEALKELAKHGEYGTATELVARAALNAAGVEGV